MDLQALKTEITTDPQSIGYAGKTDDQIAALLNQPSRQINRESFAGGQLVGCIVKAEYTALAAADKAWINLLAATASPIPITAQLRTDLGATFPVGSATRTALLVMVKRTGSRAEELNLGGQPTASDVADAKRLP